MTNNEAQKDLNFYSFVKDNLIFTENWRTKKVPNKYVADVLSKASKRGTGHRGEPDFIYFSEINKLLILLENKDSVSRHESLNRDKPTEYAVDGVLWYIDFFKADNLESENKRYFEDWKFFGIALSGDMDDEYNHLVSTFVLNQNEIKELEYKQILNERDYLNYFVNINVEEITKSISDSSKRINNYLRNIDSQDRPILLSALMICLFDDKKNKNDFKDEYIRWSPSTIVNNIPTTVESILKNQGIPQEKISVLLNKLAFIKSDIDINNSDVIKNILNELKLNVVHLFERKSNYDIIGKFYEEFLRYAGVANVKKGIVLTPYHITTLFTELIDIKTNDVFFDPCCGTGSFLIAAMNSLIEKIDNSNIANKTEIKNNIKENQLIGFEKNSTMYSLSISNMLFRGDGKSQIHNVDFFSEEADEILRNLPNKPTIGFINPPYGGKDNADNNTKKEIQFLTKMLDNVSRYGIIIAPLSTYFKDDTIRNAILTKHTLKYVINMPHDLFLPNAATHTAIAVFETNQPHNNKEVVFYDLKDDGLVLSKNKGRTDAYNRWDSIKKDMVKKLKNPDPYIDNMNLLKANISNNDEWIIQAHAKTDYSKLSETSFVRAIKEYVIFSTKKKLSILDKDLDEITILEILNQNLIQAREIINEVGDE